MEKALPFFNWSLRKALATQQDNFTRARIRIVFTILIFSLLKVLVAIGFTIAYTQERQLARALIALVVYSALFKLLLYRPGWLAVLMHIMLGMGLLLVYTSIFVYSHNVNLLTVQFTFMIVLSAFYTQGLRYGIFYSLLGIFPVLLSLIIHDDSILYFTTGTEQLVSPGFEILVVLNFISLIMAHYLFYQAFHTNLKEKEKLNRELQMAITEANQLATSKSNFLSTMSHELRTPLNSVIGITELLIDDKPEERQKENLKILQFSALDLLSLINNVLDFNKMDSARLELETVPICLPDFMRSRCAALKIKANDKNLDFILDIDPRLEKITIVSDPTRLSQLIYNLVSNAIKFTEKGGVTVKLECLNDTGDGVEVQFSITDTGIGIHPNRHEAIFDMFTQAESHITRKYGGSGLGLAIVQQVLDLFGSTICLESSPGNGTSFFFTILFKTVVDTAPTEVAVKGARARGTQRILVAEDNDVNRVLIKKQFEKLGVDVVIVENGKLAYEALMLSHFHAIFMDLHMPVMDGYEATRQIRSHADPAKAGIHIVAFTASVTEQEKILETGFDDFLYKPVNMTDLGNKLEKIANLFSTQNV